jgi:hypothetical protein
MGQPPFLSQAYLALPPSFLLWIRDSKGSFCPSEGIYFLSKGRMRFRKWESMFEKPWVKTKYEDQPHF